MDRRTFLLTTTGLGASLVAGCSEESDSSSSPDDGSNDGGPNGDGSNGDGGPGTPTPDANAPGDGGSNTATATETPAETETPTATETPTPGTQTATVPVGERVDGDDLSMVVRSVDRQSQIGQFQEADQGNTFVIVGLAVKNTTENRFLNFSGFLQTQVTDAEDYSYDQTFAMTGQDFEGGQLAPGEVSRGNLVYEVPEDAEGLQLQFDFEAFSVFEFDRVTVDLAEQAASIADLSQTLRVDIHDVGEQVTHDGISVTVNSVEFRESLGRFAQADEGNEFAVVNITTTNDTDEEQSLSTLLQMKVKDGTGVSASPSITGMSSLDRGYNEGQPLASGESRRGEVPYEVGKDASPLYWTFEFTLWVDGDKTFWQIR